MVEQLNATTYEFQLAGGDKVEIGKREVPTFLPYLKANRFGGECFVGSMLAGEIEGEVEVEVEEDKIKSKYKIKYGDFEQEIEDEFYPQAPTKQWELGSFEHNITISKRPQTNKIVLALESQGLRFNYQAALTPQEIEDGDYQPENITGSYAVRHLTKGGMVTRQDAARGITTGKALHIPRRRIVDADGNWVYPEQLISNGFHIITIPQDFIDSAKYPIRHVAGDTFGYTVQGGNSGAIENVMRGTPEAVAAGTGDSMHAYVVCSAAHPFKTAIYNANALIANSPTTEVSKPGAFDGLIDFVFPGADPTWGALTLHPVCWSEQLAGTCKLYYDNGATAHQYDAEAYDGFPNPANFAGGQARDFSVWCVFTPSAVAADELGAFIMQHNPLGLNIQTCGQVRAG